MKKPSTIFQSHLQQSLVQGMLLFVDLAESSGKNRTSLSTFRPPVSKPTQQGFLFAQTMAKSAFRSIGILPKKEALLSIKISAYMIQQVSARKKLFEKKRGIDPLHFLRLGYEAVIEFAEKEAALWQTLPTKNPIHLILKRYLPYLRVPAIENVPVDARSLLVSFPALSLKITRSALIEGDLVTPSFIQGKRTSAMYLKDLFIYLPQEKNQRLQMQDILIAKKRRRSSAHPIVFLADEVDESVLAALFSQNAFFLDAIYLLRVKQSNRPQLLEKLQLQKKNGFYEGFLDELYLQSGYASLCQENNASLEKFAALSIPQIPSNKVKEINRLIFSAEKTGAIALTSTGTFAKDQTIRFPSPESCSLWQGIFSSLGKRRVSYVHLPHKLPSYITACDEDLSPLEHVKTLYNAALKASKQVLSLDALISV